jgi:hypothetical protein
VQNKPQKPEKLVQAFYLKAEREIVIHFDKNTGFIPTDKLARDVLNMVNRALVDTKMYFLLRSCVLGFRGSIHHRF